jgi:hypothetical protein
VVLVAPLVDPDTALVHPFCEEIPPYSCVALPDLVAALNGQVDVVLDGRIDSVKGRMRTTFDTVPDVPVSRFMLTVRGGKRRGLLVNSSNLCARKYRVIARFKAQNGKSANQRPKLRTPCKHHRRKGNKTKRR